MNWKRYKVTYYVRGEPNRLDPMFSYSCVEALNAKDAMSMVKASYKREQEAGIRNLPQMKEVTFTSMQVQY